MSKIEILREQIVASIGRKVQTPKDFSYLSECIYNRLHQCISPTTLKRIWGYQQDEGPSRISTMNILAQFCGYKDWDSFSEDCDKGLNQSSAIITRNLFAQDLKIGDIVQLYWAPDRFCKIKYLGEHRFLILESKNTKLQPENTFKCDVFIENEPLYIYDLVQDKLSGVCYCAGKKDGIHFEQV